MSSLASRPRNSAPASAGVGAPLPLPAWSVFAWAAAVGLAMSTQYLFQPFVWLNWDIADVLGGFLVVAAERAVVALAIAAMLVVALRHAPRRARRGCGRRDRRRRHGRHGGGGDAR